MKNKIKGLFFLLTALFVLASCSSSDDSSSTSCEQKLDNGEFATVSEDTSCGAYYRASAYLGRAGFLFSNFLADGATSDFRSALGISSSVSDWDTWDGKTYYANAMVISGDATGDDYENKTRSTDIVEIHYFATLAALLAETYIRLDTDADGSIETSEIQSFTGISTITGSNSIAANNILQFVSGNDVYLINYSTGKCAKNPTPTQTGVMPSTTYDLYDTTNCGLFSASDLSGATNNTVTVTGTCNAVVAIDSVQSMFTSVVSSSNSITTWLSTFITSLGYLNSDLDDLGLDADSDLRSALSSFQSTMDNGATCSNSTLSAVDKLLNLVNVSASSVLTDYSSYNKVTSSTISSSASITLGSSFSATSGSYTFTFSCSSINARLVFLNAAGTDYVDYYNGALTNTYNVFASIYNLQRDSSGTLISDTEGDDQVSFRELLCAAN